jgi:FtsZ-binding cell division protein ZapB
MEELTEELEQKEDQIVTLKDDIAELQIEIEELKENAAAAAAAAVEASTTAAAAKPSVNVDELLEKVVDGLTAKLTRYNPADAVKTDGWSVVELAVKRLLDAQHHDHESEVDAMEKEWNKIEDEAVERARGLEAQVERLEKQVAKLECEKQAGGGATDHERPRSLRARSGRSAGGDDDDDNGPASDWRQKAKSLEKELASLEAELKTTTSDLAACEEEKQTLLRAQRFVSCVSCVPRLVSDGAMNVAAGGWSARWRGRSRIWRTLRRSRRSSKRPTARSRPTWSACEPTPTMSSPPSAARTVCSNAVSPRKTAAEERERARFHLRF